MLIPGTIREEVAKLLSQKYDIGRFGYKKDAGGGPALSITLDKKIHMRFVFKKAPKSKSPEWTDDKIPVLNLLPLGKWVVFENEKKNSFSKDELTVMYYFDSRTSHKSLVTQGIKEDIEMYAELGKAYLTIVSKLDLRIKQYPWLNNIFKISPSVKGVNFLQMMSFLEDSNKDRFGHLTRQFTQYVDKETVGSRSISDIIYKTFVPGVLLLRLFFFQRQHDQIDIDDDRLLRFHFDVFPSTKVNSGRIFSTRIQNDVYGYVALIPGFLGSSYLDDIIEGIVLRISGEIVEFYYEEALRRLKQKGLIEGYGRGCSEEKSWADYIVYYKGSKTYLQVKLKKSAYENFVERKTPDYLANLSQEGCAYSFLSDESLGLAPKALVEKLVRKLELWLESQESVLEV